VTFWLDAQRNLVIYAGQPGPLAQYIPDLTPLNGAYFAIPRTLRNLTVAAYYNWPVPPIMTDESYDWPHEPGKSPLPHQKVTANFTALHARMFNLSDPGCMKTLSTLWAIDYLMLHSKERFRAIVVAPLTILETTWASTIFRNFLGRRTFEILHGTPERRMRGLEADVDIFLINHDGIKVGAKIRHKVDPRAPKQKRIELRGFSAALAERKDIKLVVLDEAHGFGDPRSARSGVAEMLFGVGKRPMLKQLTGTPNATAPTDAYGMAKLSNNAFGKSFTGFRLESMLKISEFKWVPQKDGYEKARRLLTPAIRFGLDEIWDGPPMTVQRRKVELTEDQKREMKRLRNELQLIAASGHAISAANESAARQKLIQLSLGAVYDGEHVAHLIDASPRYRELEEIVESTERKVVVFVPITSVVHLVVKYLRETWKKKKRDWKCDFINGEVKAGKERDAVINAFVSDPEFKLVVADPQTATEGINEFVIADTVVWFGATDRAKAWIQGNARVRRPGQKYPSTCFQLVSNKLEEEIFDRLENNTSMQGMMLQAIRDGTF
jgi:SNF2-related domain